MNFSLMNKYSYTWASREEVTPPPSLPQAFEFPIIKLFSLDSLNIILNINTYISIFTRQHQNCRKFFNFKKGKNIR